MPTYKNKSSQMYSVGEFTFSPGEEKPVKQQYLLEIGPIVKTDDNPPIQNNFKVVFENISEVTNMSRFFNLRHTMILKVSDAEQEGSLGDTITVTAFAGITDDINDFIPIQEFIFERKQFKNQDGGDIIVWGLSTFGVPKIDPQLIDKVSEFISLQVTDFSGSGSVNVYYKAF